MANESMTFMRADGSEEGMKRPSIDYFHKIINFQIATVILMVLKV